jgi:hypothetical protein
MWEEFIYCRAYFWGRGIGFCVGDGSTKSDYPHRISMAHPLLSHPCLTPLLYIVGIGKLALAQFPEYLPFPLSPSPFSFSSLPTKYSEGTNFKEFAFSVDFRHFLIGQN